ncbi:hypothetical protein KUCAC02_036020 [Chaenocephalus aceratus]|nr:hypothetical protein KUCAC02_036020 [Chaenocephalus aceratus]
MMNFNRITSGIEIESAPLASEGLTIPHRIAVIGHANKSFTKPYDVPIEVVDSIEASHIFGIGSQLARMVKGLDGVAGKIVCFAVTATTGAKEKTVKIAASSVPSAEGTLILTFNDEIITIYYAKSEALEGLFKLIEDTINSFPNLPVTAKANRATDITITTNWTGLTANDVLITVTGDITGFTITDTKATGALPSPAKIYETFSNNWYTMAVLPFYDVETLTKISHMLN